MASKKEKVTEWLEAAEPDDIEEAARRLSMGFVYSLTPEGGEYWHGIQKRLDAMAKESRKTRRRSSRP